MQNSNYIFTFLNCIGFFRITKLCLFSHIFVHLTANKYSIFGDDFYNREKLHRTRMLAHILKKRGNMQIKLYCTLFLGNSWDCSDGGLDWLAMEEPNSTIKLRIIDYNDLVCYQQLYRAKPLPKVMDIIKVSRYTKFNRLLETHKLAFCRLQNSTVRIPQTISSLLYSILDVFMSGT